MSLSLALPDASQIGLDQVKGRLVPMCQMLRAEIRAVSDLESARELARRLDAFGHYLSDRESRDLVAAETRRTEVLIGHLLGPADIGSNQHTEPSLASETSVPRMDRSRFRLLAEHEDLVEQFLADGYVSRAALLDKLRSRGNGHARPEVLEGVFSTIVADPPWPYENRATRAAARNHYSTLSIEQLVAFEVDGRHISEWKAPAAHLYLWTTSAFLREAFRLVDAWGFTFKTTLVWVKPQLGIGNYFRSSHELVLFATCGDLKVKDSNQRSWFEAARGRHSAKPEKFYDLVERVSHGPYLELFGRPSPMFGPREGWTVLGDEA